MTRRALILIVAAVVAVGLFLTARIVDSTADNKSRATAEEACDYITAEVMKSGECEVFVDFGVVPYATTATQHIRLVNGSTEPLVLVDYTTQCKCMWLEFEREPIAVGESVDIVLHFDSRGEWGIVGNYMEIVTSRDDRPIAIWIGAEIE